MTGYPGHWHQQGSDNSGNHVKTIQGRLNQRGYSLLVDGIFGLNTRYSVRDFQANHPPLTIDGIVGFNTWTAL